MDGVDDADNSSLALLDSIAGLDDDEITDSAMMPFAVYNSELAAAPTAGMAHPAMHGMGLGGDAIRAATTGMGSAQKKKQKGAYLCSKCGLPKKGHVCTAKAGVTAAGSPASSSGDRQSLAMQPAPPSSAKRPAAAHGLPSSAPMVTSPSSSKVLLKFKARNKATRSAMEAENYRTKYEMLAPVRRMGSIAASPRLHEHILTQPCIDPPAHPPTHLPSLAEALETTSDLQQACCQVAQLG